MTTLFSKSCCRVRRTHGIFIMCYLILHSSLPYLAYSLVFVTYRQATKTLLRDPIHLRRLDHVCSNYALSLFHQCNTRHAYTIILLVAVTKQLSDANRQHRGPNGNTLQPFFFGTPSVARRRSHLSTARRTMTSSGNVQRTQNGILAHSKRADPTGAPAVRCSARL